MTQQISFKSISAPKVMERRKKEFPPFIIDLRPPAAYLEGHLAGAFNFPLEHLTDHLEELPPFSAIVVYSDEAGQDLELALNLLAENGFTNFMAVEGGWPALKDAVKGEAKLSDWAPEDWLARVDSVLTERVRPTLQADGGDVRLLEVTQGHLKLKYLGACNGCQASSGGTLIMIRAALAAHLNEEFKISLG